MVEQAVRNRKISFKNLRQKKGEKSGKLNKIYSKTS